jgi:hypothetical protein
VGKRIVWVRYRKIALMLTLTAVGCPIAAASPVQFALTAQGDFSAVPAGDTRVYVLSTANESITTQFVLLSSESIFNIVGMISFSGRFDLNHPTAPLSLATMITPVPSEQPTGLPLTPEDTLSGFLTLPGGAAYLLGSPQDSTGFVLTITGGTGVFSGAQGYFPFGGFSAPNPASIAMICSTAVDPCPRYDGFFQLISNTGTIRIAAPPPAVPEPGTRSLVAIVALVGYLLRTEAWCRQVRNVILREASPPCSIPR